MKPTEKDLQNAREWLNANQNDLCSMKVKDQPANMLAMYVEHLHQRGVIKFTKGREESEPNIKRCSFCNHTHIETNGKIYNCHACDTPI